MMIQNDIERDAVRDMTADELDAVSAGTKIDVFRNERAKALIAMSNAWGASVGIEGTDDTPR
jgi:hypothetical protein